MSGYHSEQPNHIEPVYLAGLGLNQAPFTSEHLDEFIYLDDDRHQRFNTIQQLAQGSNTLLLITGEHGVGKTSLLERFTNTVDDSWSICKVQANTMMDAHQLLANIARGFGLQVTNQPATVLQDTLYQYLVTIQHNGQVPFLVIDDAHELPKDALQTLFTLADAESGEGNLLRIILFCEPQIEIMLESPSIKPLRDRITHTIDIPPFNEEQTAEYLKHRLAVSGFTGTSPFQPREIKKIYEVSHGIPARINELAHMHLNGEVYASTDPELLPEEFTRLPFSKKRVAAGAVVITVVIAALLLRGTSDEQPGDKAQIKIPINEITNTQSPSIVKPLPEAGQDKEIELSIKRQTEKTSPLSKQPDESTIPLAKPVTKKTGSENTPTKPVITARIRSILPNPVIGNRNKQSILINGDGFSEDTQVIVSWSGNKKKLDSSQVTYENRNQLRMHITVGSKADNWTVQTDDPVYGKSNIHEFNVTTAPVTGLQTAKWINQQHPDQFTLQLLGTYNKYSLTSFAKQHNLEKDTAWFVTQRNGRNWYTLVYGRFTTRESAKQAISVLPVALQKTKPWIRRFDSIQSGSKTVVKTTQTNNAVEPQQNNAGNSQPASLDLTAQAAWLWSQNPQHFTIQLLSGHNLDALRRFMHKHQLEKNASFYRTRRNGSQWFVLLHGSYSDRSKAKAAIEKLPTEIRKTNPWPRRFLDIHGELSSQ